MTNRVCKNKKCLKRLPEAYKYKYCEACRNRLAQYVKIGFKTVVGFVGVAASVVIPIAKAGEFNSKK